MKIFIFLLLPFLLFAQEFRVANYNVENLFDLHKSGHEYPEYIPNGRAGWNKNAFAIKVRNIAKVIHDMHPDIIALEEIESKEALLALQKELKLRGDDFSFSAIANKKHSTVKTALLSKFPIISIRQIDPDPLSLRLRDILEAHLIVDGYPLEIFVNHWKALSGPESMRIKSAKALEYRLHQIKPGTDYILIGDFNSDYDQDRKIRRSQKLNDTHGISGIDDILKTYKNSKPVKKINIKNGYLTDLWLELPFSKRWSHNFYGKKSSLDHIILPLSMFDKKGINYRDKSFHRFMPYYIFKRNGAIFRWQMHHGKFLDEGYSDHLPIYADFLTRPFKKEKIVQITNIHNIADIYKVQKNKIDIFLNDAVVIYKKYPIAIVKKSGDRAIAIYKDIKRLKLGHKYNLEFKKIGDYHGLTEITKIGKSKDLGKVDIGPLLLHNYNDLSDKNLMNEVISSISGIYKNGYLHYEKEKSIRLYIPRGHRLPKDGEKITLHNVRISFYSEPELVY